MSRGKTTCKVLKEVRRKIATVSDKPVSSIVTVRLRDLR